MNNQLPNLFINAVTNGNIPDVNLYIGFGLNVNTWRKTSNGSTALHIACSNNDLSMIEFLLTHGATDSLTIRNNSYQTPLFYCRSEQAFRLLVNHGAKVDLNEKNGLGLTMLHNAIRINDISYMKFLLDYGYNPNLTTIDVNNSCLHLAVMLMDQRMVELLLKYNVDTTIRNRDGLTARDIAVNKLTRSANYQQIIELIDQHTLPDLKEPADE